MPMQSEPASDLTTSVASANGRRPSSRSPSRPPPLLLRLSLLVAAANSFSPPSFGGGCFVRSFGSSQWTSSSPAAVGARHRPQQETTTTATAIFRRRHRGPRDAPPTISPARRASSPAAEGLDARDDDDEGQVVSPPVAVQRRRRDISVPTVLLAAFLNLLGFTMSSPIQPALGEHFSLPLGASFGSLSSAYPLGMLFGVFIWPALSDVLGRKTVMGLTLAGSGTGLMLQAHGITRGWGLERFLAARVLTGCFAGNSPISKAYLADRIGADLARYLAWKDAASTLAFIAGPSLGGLAYGFFRTAAVGGGDNSIRIAFVIFCSAMASLVASASVMLFVSDADGASSRQLSSSSSSTARVKSDKSTPREVANGPELAIVSCPLGTKLWTGVMSVACVSALYHAADSAFFAFFPSLLRSRLGFDTRAVGATFTSLAVVSFLMSAFFSSRFLGAFGPVAACTAGLGAAGTGLWTLARAASLPAEMGIGVVSALVLGASALYYAGVPLYGPSVPSMLLQCVPRHRRGAVLGFDGAMNTMARVASPLVLGRIHGVRGAGACFGAAGTCAYAAACMALLRRWIVLRKMFRRSGSVDETE